MTEKEFLGAVRDSPVAVYCKTPTRWGGFQMSVRNTMKTPIEITDCLRVSWRSGGIGGGSCWDEGESRHYPIIGDPEPEFEDLDLLLEAICPDVSFLNYKKLMKESLMETGSETEYEYYGNSTTYSYKQIELKKLYDALVKVGII